MPVALESKTAVAVEAILPGFRDGRFRDGKIDRASCYGSKAMAVGENPGGDFHVVLQSFADIYFRFQLHDPVFRCERSFFSGNHQPRRQFTHLKT